MTFTFRTCIGVLSKFVALSIMAWVLPSCNASKTIDRAIASHYTLTPPTQKVEAPSHLRASFTYGDTSFFKGPSVTERNTNSILPLLLYTKAKQGYTTRLHPQFPANQLINYIHHYSSLETIADDLNGRTIVLKIEEMPLQFSYEVKEEVILLFPATRVQSDFYSINDNIIVSFTVHGAKGQEKSGTIELENPTKQIMILPALSRGYYIFAREFLEKYDRMLKKSAKLIVDEVLSQI
jgi:hypothetical protein